MIITFVIVSQIPLIIAFIDTIHPLSPRQLLRLEKWVIIGSLVIALLAPFTYDFVTSILIAVPIIVLYNLSIIIVVMKHARKKSAAKVKARHTVAEKPTASENPPTLPPTFTPSPLSEYLISEQPAMQPRRVFMDISRSNTRPQPVTPAAWVREREIKRSQLNQHVRLISDIRVSPRTNHASA